MKTESPISFIPSGMVMVVILLHPQKASCPMTSTLPDISTDCSSSQAQKAEGPISNTLSGITTDFIVLPPKA